MLTFKDFLTEGRSEQLSTQQLISILKKNCKEFLSFTRYPIVYRGVKGPGDIKLVKPSQFERQSLPDAKGNVYTVLMDSLDSWSKFPKRSKSIICSTDYWGAEEFAKPHLVIPFDGAKWGICPDNDIFYSFGAMDEYLGTQPESLGYEFFNMYTLLKKHKATSIKSSKDVQYPKDYKTLLQFLKELDAFILKYLEMTDKKLSNREEVNPHEIDRLNDEIGDTGNFLESLIKLRKKKNVNIGQILNDIMGPGKNDFKLLTTSQLTVLRNDREIWTDSNAILIQHSQFENVLKDVYDELNIKQSIDIDGNDEDDNSALFLKKLSKAILQ